MKRLTRTTTESQVSIGVASLTRETVKTGYRFFDHMLFTLFRYSDLGLEVEARGDMEHHLVEDVALTLGAVVHKLAPSSAARFGTFTMPMDDALVLAAIDLGGRPYFAGRLRSARYTHFFRSFATAANATLHLKVLRGTDTHHITEAAFKACGLALRAAMRHGDGGVFSTKGNVTWAEE